MNTADLWFRGDSFWPGALWRIPGLEVPQIEAEMRAAAAWNITRKFVDRLVASPRTRRREERAVQARHSRMAVGRTAIQRN